MNYAPQIIETFKASSVERILVIDDAYDPPKFDPEFGGDMLDILSAADFDLREHVNEHALSEEDREAAIDALNYHRAGRQCYSRSVSRVVPSFC